MHKSSRTSFSFKRQITYKLNYLLLIFLFALLLPLRSLFITAKFLSWIVSIKQFCQRQTYDLRFVISGLFKEEGIKRDDRLSNMTEAENVLEKLFCRPKFAKFLL